MGVAMSPGAKTALSALASVLAIVAALLFLVTPISTGGFIDAPPKGADAMGLVVLLIASILAVLAQLAACIALAFNGRLGGLGWLRGWRVFPVVVLAGVAALGVLVVWADKAGVWIVPLGLLCALFAPLCASIMLIAAAWQEPSPSPGMLMRVMSPVVVLSAACGVAMSTFGIYMEARANAEAYENARTARAAEQAEFERREQLSPLQRVQEDYAQFDAGAPLWTVIPLLPETDDPQVADFIVTRALQVPDLDAEVQRTLVSDYAIYRYATARMIELVPADALHEEWAEALEASMRVSAEKIEANHEWFTVDDQTHPNPPGHIASLIAARARFAESDAGNMALARLRSAVEAAPESAQRNLALAAFERRH